MINIVKKLIGNAPSLKQASTKVLVALVLAYAIIIAMFVIGWSFNAYLSNKFELNMLIELLKVMTGPSTVAAVFFVMKGLVDANHNGIPDNLEEEKK